MTGEARAPLKVSVLGANGQLARSTTRILLDQSEARLTLYLRRARRLGNPDPSRARIVEGGVLDETKLHTSSPARASRFAGMTSR